MNAKSKFPRLGARQSAMLQFLGDFGGEWFDGCGRHWKSPAFDTAVYRRLVILGLVEERRTCGKVNDISERPLFCLTKAGRDHYYAMTGRHVSRRGARTASKRESTLTPVKEAVRDKFSSDADPIRLSYFTRPLNGVQGWTVATNIDCRGALVLGGADVWWCMDHGSVAAKTLAKLKAREINARRAAGDPKAEVVPIRIA